MGQTLLKQNRRVETTKKQRNPINKLGFEASPRALELFPEVNGDLGRALTLHIWGITPQTEQGACRVRHGCLCDP